MEEWRVTGQAELFEAFVSGCVWVQSEKQYLKCNSQSTEHNDSSLFHSVVTVALSSATALPLSNLLVHSSNAPHVVTAAAIRATDSCANVLPSQSCIASCFCIQAKVQVCIEV
jgi:hypothetical protein